MGGDGTSDSCATVYGMFLLGIIACIGAIRLAFVVVDVACVHELSMRVAQYGENNHACIYFCDTRFFRGAMLRGTMEVLTDSASKEMIWQEGDTMYYPEGVTDPDYCVLKFTATSGRFYSNFKSESFIVE